MGAELTASAVPLVGLLGVLVLTHGAVQQTLPAGERASEVYLGSTTRG